MAIYAQSSCTLSTIIDVKAVYTYYCLAQSTIGPDASPKDKDDSIHEPGNPPGSSSITIIYEGQEYIWTLVEPSLEIEQDGTIRGAVGQLYYKECVEFSDDSFDWGPLMTSSTYAAAKAAYNLSINAVTQATQANEATALLGGHFIYNTTWTTEKTPHSANVVQYVEREEQGQTIDVSSNPAQWGYNTHIGSNGIKLRYNETDLSSWTENGIEFYNPQSHEASANLSSTGLNITEGSIQLGERIVDYFLSRDKEIKYPLKKVYYLKEGDSEPYRYVPVPVSNFFEAVSETEGKNPSEEEWYVKSDTGTDEYILTSDTEPNSEITYYKLKNIVPKKVPYYELRDTHAFQVTSDGYLNAQAGWIGGLDSYVKLEQDDNSEDRYLDVRLSQLDMLLNDDLYGQENVVDVLDIVSQQSEFIRLWTGETIWLYYKDGEGIEPYTVYQYIDNDTGEINYYYDTKQFQIGQYFPTTDTIAKEGKEYYSLSYHEIENPEGNPSEQDYYELSSAGSNVYVPSTDTEVQHTYKKSEDEAVDSDKDYYEYVTIYILITNPTGKPIEQGYYEFDSTTETYSPSTDVAIVTGKDYYILSDKYALIDYPVGTPSSQGYYEIESTKTYYEADYQLVKDTQSIQGCYEPYVSVWEKLKPKYRKVTLSAENPSEQGYYELKGDQYILTQDTTIAPGKTYYEQYPPVEELNSIEVAGLSQSLKFTNDSFGNQQKLIVSSANDTENEKTKVEIDPQYLKFLVETDENATLELGLNYNNIVDQGSLSIKTGERTVFSIDSSSDYALSTTTGFKAGALAMFHYGRGLAIGIM